MQFRGTYAFLSNMYQGKPFSVVINHQTYTFTCVESAFQAHKDVNRAHEFESLSGYDAKKLGRKVNLRPDWETIKDDVMLTCLRAKFSDPNLKQKLRTISEPIVEENHWHDTYWGVCNGIGKNRLGQLLEQIKTEKEKQS